MDDMLGERPQIHPEVIVSSQDLDFIQIEDSTGSSAVELVIEVTTIIIINLIIKVFICFTNT